MKDLLDRYDNLIKEGRIVDASGLREVIKSRLEELNQKVVVLQQENASLKQDAARYRRVLLSARGYGSESWSEWLANEVDDALGY